MASFFTIVHVSDKMRIGMLKNKQLYTFKEENILWQEK